MEQLVLYQPPRAWGTPNISPFCAKLETYLRITDVPYKIGPFSRSKAPKGKVPFVDIGGTYIGDSQLIIEELEKRLAAEGKTPLDAGIAPRDHAIARMVRRTIEEGYYFVGLYQRWSPDAGYELMKPAFKQFVPGLAIPLVRRMMRKKLHEQGTGRHTYDEVMAIGAADLDALAELLGDRPFLLGDKPRTIDCTVFGFLEATLGFPLDGPLKKRGESHANLTAYRQRIRERWWTDLPASSGASA
ncbi:MAG TPA: glutathione S-transferase family protein [Kofleriaceae bacterium]|nr:glutathione S-transferase family protein [Kofleriaceae bacterium]